MELPPRQRRVAILALALAAFALNLNTNVFGALLPFARRELALADGAAGWLVAAAAAGSAVGALAAGLLARRQSRRQLLTVGLLLFTVASALHLWPGGAWPLAAWRALAGCAVGLAYAAASALVAEVAPYAGRGAAMGWFNAGLFLAIPLGLPVAVGFAAAGHWRAIFLVQALVGGLGLWAALRAVPVRGRRRAAPAGAGGLASLRGLLGLLGQRGVAAVLVATLLHVGSFFTTVQLAGAWLDQSGLLAKEQQLSLWIGLGLLAAAGSAGFGALSDRLGKLRFVIATSAVLVGCFLGLASGPEAWLLAVLGGVLAVVAAARTGPLQALVSGLVPKDRLTEVMALRGAAMQFGVVLFAAVAAPLGAAVGFHGVLWLGAGCQALSLVAVAVGVPARRSLA